MEVRRSWTRENLRDSLIALYLGRVRSNDIPKKFNQVSRQRAQVLVTRIRPGLHFTNEDWSLLRAASELSGCSAFSRLNRCQNEKCAQSQSRPWQKVDREEGRETATGESYL